MDATGRAAAREAAGRETVNAFRAHHFAGLGCRPTGSTGSTGTAGRAPLAGPAGRTR
ncbi:hypothetical protein ABZ721_25200 [Streptomyces sp. NPDC006733]|uniref:hypothetical protein n=1 Tax=Streptomyces sp. NPDC006733 TaxID=3155460 RepID=UPI0033DEF0F2